MSISPKLVKELRERTGAGMMDCKKALEETSGVVDEAVDWLRKKGLASAAKKAGRSAAEGLIGCALHESGKHGVILEVNAETDFVGRNEKFQDYVKTLSHLGLTIKGDLESLKSSPYPGAPHTVSEELSHLIAIVGENMNLRRVDSLEVDQGIVTSYVHASVAPGLGRIGVLLALEGKEGDALKDLAKQLAMHIAANNPQFLRLEEITDDQKAREKEVLKDQVRATMEKIENFIIKTIVPQTPGVLTIKEINKVQFESQSKFLANAIRKNLGSEDMLSIDKIKELALLPEIIQETVEADLDKFVNSSALYEQPFIMNPKQKIKEVLEHASKKFGHPLKIKAFVRYELGEGIEKKEENFAAEVAAQLS